MLPFSRIAPLLALLALAPTLAACGEAESSPAPEKPPVHATPPPAGSSPRWPEPGSLTFAIRTLYLGDTERDGTPKEKDGWKSYGYDLDGKISTKDSTDLCKPRGAKPLEVYPDGYDGIDNGFGKNVLPTLATIWGKQISSRVNLDLAAGGPTVLIEIDGLGIEPSYNPLVARVYEGADRGERPLYDGSDVWPVRPESLLDPGDITSAAAQARESYVVDE